ncbi:hypothetical protein HY638_03850 [Candidatus Woesearchaeota archaeon]|nr:hypothetical protein [Candidatus Woesearchaeota archaeon]
MRSETQYSLISGLVGLTILAGAGYIAYKGIPGIVRGYSAIFSSTPAIEVHVKDLDCNGLPETFVEIGGVRYFSEIDGKLPAVGKHKPVEECIKTP